MERPVANPPGMREAAPSPPPAANGDALRTRSLAVSGLFLLALIYTLHFAGPFLFPIVVGALLAATVFAVVSLSTPAARWLEKTPANLQKIEHRMRQAISCCASWCTSCRACATRSWRWRSRTASRPMCRAVCSWSA